MFDISEFISVCESNIINKDEIVLGDYLKDNDIYPIYILLTYIDTTLTKIIEFITHDPFSHASIGFDYKLKDIYSFGRKVKDSMATFINENINEGIFKDVADNAIYSLYVTFVNKEKYDLMRKKLNEFKKRSPNLRFSFKGLLNIAMGKESHFADEYFCSQFVTEILKAGDASYISRDPSLYTPSDLRKIKNIYFISKGKLRNYDYKNTENKIKRLLLEKNVPIK